jgi:hypothetical protein
MTADTSIEWHGRSSEHPVELEEERLRDTNLVECREASFRPSRTPFKAGSGEHDTQKVLRQQAPRRLDDRIRDSFLRFRDDWVRNRARDIRQAGSISFNTCSEDAASISALNEFYKCRVFDGFNAEDREDKELEIEMMEGSCDFGRSSIDRAAVEELRFCRIVCSDKVRRLFGKACGRRTKSRI